MSEIGEGGETKRDRDTENDEPCLNILSRLSREIIDIILTFVSGGDLDRLDLTCHELRGLTPEHWTSRARQRFGRTFIGDLTGKRAWRAGLSLTMPHRSLFIPVRKYTGAMSFSGTNHHGVSSPSCRIIVTGSDDHQHNGGNGAIPEIPLLVRRTSDLSSLGCVPGRLRTWQLAVLGTDNEEIIVHTMGNRYLEAIRLKNPSGPKSRLLVDFSSLDPIAVERAKSTPNDDGLHIIGSPELLVASLQHVFYVFVPGKKKVLHLAHRFANPIPSSPPPGSGVQELSWTTPEFGTHSFSYAHSGTISVWKVALPRNATNNDANQTASLENVLTVDTDFRDGIGAVAVTEKYVAVSCDRTKLVSVYNHGGSKLHDLSEGLNRAEYYDSDNNSFCHPISMYAQGELLISSSVEGAAVCVWCMRTGKLLQKLDHAMRRSPHSSGLERANNRRFGMTYHNIWVMDALPDGCDATALTPLNGGSAVMMSTMGGSSMVWAFPRDEVERRRLEALQEMELEQLDAEVEADEW